MKRLLLPLLAALVIPAAVNAEVSDEVHKRCKDVRDYAGCVQIFSNNSEASKEDCDEVGWCIAAEGFDQLGMPKLQGWEYRYEPAKHEIYYVDRERYKVNVKGKFGRYYSKKVVYRGHQNPIQARAGRPTTVLPGIATTRCTGYANPASCISVPGKPIVIPGSRGTTGSTGGVIQEFGFMVFDCKEANWNIIYENGKKGQRKWEPINDSDNKFASYCASVPDMKVSELNAFSKKSIKRRRAGRSTLYDD